MNNEDKGEKTMESSAALNFGGLDSMFDDMFTPAPKNTVEENKTEQKELTAEETQKLQGKVENISSVNIDTALSKLTNIEVELNNEFVERNELIKIMLLSVVTSSNLLMLGPPGTARVDIIA